MAPPPLTLCDWDQFVGRPLGQAPFPAADGVRRTPFQALTDAVRPAVLRGACWISFSGGHDSSLVLAAALHVARREGCPLPTPITWRFTDAPGAEESELQERVIAALRPDDWVRMTAVDDLDLVGATAQQVLTRHGVVFPPNAHFHVPIYARADGGTLLTGFGGDQLFAPVKRPRRPAWLRSHDADYGLPWLRPAAARRDWQATIRHARGMPRAAVERPRWRISARTVALATQTARRLAAERGAQVEQPLLHPGWSQRSSRSGRHQPRQVAGRT